MEKNNLEENLKNYDTETKNLVDGLKKENKCLEIKINSLESKIKDIKIF